jgi:uncharacterized peroxidase-related enzyme
MTNLFESDVVTGKAKDLYDDIQKTFGMVPNLFKAIAPADPDWLELNWNREKKIMVEDGALDKKTRELIAMTVSIVNNCEYCKLAHEAMAIHQGASQDEVNHAKQVIELFASFNAIANSFPEVPCDIRSL